MPMIAGLVSVNSAGIASGTGLAKELYDDYLPDAGDIPAGPTGAQSKRQVAKLCNSFAKTVVAHIVANATVTVTPGVPVSTAGTAAAQTGATTAPGVGTVA